MHSDSSLHAAAVRPADCKNIICKSCLYHAEIDTHNKQSSTALYYITCCSGNEQLLAVVLSWESTGHGSQHLDSIDPIVTVGCVQLARINIFLFSLS